MPDALRADVRLLGELLGQVLTEAGGPELLEDVERLRSLTIDAASSDTPTAFAEAEAMVGDLTQQRAEEVARAFTCYFHLVNLAEEYHRVRALRRRDHSLQSRPESSFPAAFAQLAAEIGNAEAERRLHALEFHPVFTAHPTEARRRSISAAIRRISVLVAERDDPRLGDDALADNRRRLLAEIDSLWRTAQLRPHKPSPLDEVRTAMGVFDETLFRALPTVYRYLDDWLLGDDAGHATPAVPPFVRLGSWIGGDRDGNPFVTASITRAAAEIAHQHVLMGYENVAANLARMLTMDDAGTPASAELRELAAHHTELLGADRAQQIDARSQDAPYRRVMLTIRERLVETRLGCGRGRDGDVTSYVPGCEDLGESPAAYGSARELEYELTVVQRSLLAAGDARAAHGKLQEFIWQVQTFGFHLAELEVRQHSTVHARALEAIAQAGGPTEDLDEQ
ncbi:MAG: phosphoenolpyruvate carboxylase, partial [Actinomycetes bacterium]|nr:phosphoenolpyruvate carboxylase [Actinomycetes bacterium]